MTVAAGLVASELFAEYDMMALLARNSARYASGFGREEALSGAVAGALSSAEAVALFYGGGEPDEVMVRAVPRSAARRRGVVFSSEVPDGGAVRRDFRPTDGATRRDFRVDPNTDYGDFSSGLNKMGRVAKRGRSKSVGGRNVARKPKRIVTVNRSNLQGTFRAMRGGVPGQQIVPLRWAQTVSLASVQATGGWLSFVANSMTPYPTSAGHQPMGWDQWAAFFNSYVVLMSRMTVSVLPKVNESVATPQGPLVCVLKTADAASSGDVHTAIENGSAQYAMFTNSGTSMGRKVVLRSKYNARKYFHVQNPRDDDSLTATTAAAPTNLVHWGIGLQNADSSDTTLKTIYFTVVIELFVLFFEAKQLPTS